MRVFRTISAVALLVLFTLTAPAQTYRPGDIVVFDYHREDKVGRVVRQDSSGVLIVHREADGSYNTSTGFQAYYPLTSVKGRLGDRAAAPPSAPAPAPAPLPIVASGAGLMTQAEILDYLQRNIGADGTQWAARGRDRHNEILAEQIKRRGVNFHYQSIGPYADAVGKNGGDSKVTYAMRSNVGPLASRDFFLGRWSMIQIGGTVTFVQANVLYRQMERAGIAGALAIQADGTFSWQIQINDPPDQHVRGRWRQAAKAEMDLSDKGGFGIVLPQSKSGQDWIVISRVTEGQVGDMVTVANLQYRQQQQLGSRR